MNYCEVCDVPIYAPDPPDGFAIICLECYEVVQLLRAPTGPSEYHH